MILDEDLQYAKARRVLAHMSGKRREIKKWERKVAELTNQLQRRQQKRPHL